MCFIVCIRNKAMFKLIPLLCTHVHTRTCLVQCTPRGSCPMKTQHVSKNWDGECYRVELFPFHEKHYLDYLHLKEFLKLMNVNLTSSNHWHPSNPPQCKIIVLIVPQIIVLPLELGGDRSSLLNKLWTFCSILQNETYFVLNYSLYNFTTTMCIPISVCGLIPNTWWSPLDTP